MSWAENEKLNEWIERAFENGKREEQERIIKLIPKYMETVLSWGHETASKELIALIKGKPTECECDPCGNENCTCQGKRCDFCKGQD